MIAANRLRLLLTALRPGREDAQAAERVQAIQGRLDAATPGPWEMDSNTGGEHEVEGCEWCANPDWHAGVRDERINEAGVRVHRHNLQAPDWHPVVTVDGKRITGNYDWEAGGVCSSREDAELISRTPKDTAFLLARVAHLERVLAELDHPLCGYVGNWHSHPLPVGPSPQDMEALRDQAAGDFAYVCSST